MRKGHTSRCSPATAFSVEQSGQLRVVGDQFYAGVFVNSHVPSSTLHTPILNKNKMETYI